jgi:DNA-binding beta-propeller fold protein YncE
MRRLAVLGLAGALAFTFVGSPASRAAMIASNWPVGKAPFGLAFDSTTGKVYVANSETAMPDGTGRISVVDPATGSVGSITTSLTANFVVADASARRLYSSNATLSGSSASVDVFDLDGGAAVATIGGVGGLGLGLDTAARRLFAGGHTLRIIDTTTNATVGTPLPPPSGGAWFGVAVDPSRLRLYLTNADPNAPGLFAYDYNAQGDLTPASTDPRIALPRTVRYAVAVDSVRHLIFAAGSDTTGGGAPSAFYVIDPDTLSVIHTTTISGFPMGIALAPSTNRIYVAVDASRTSGAVYALDDATFAVTETIPLQALAPGPPLLHTDGRLYTGNYNTNTGMDSTLVALDPANHAPAIRTVALNPTAPRTNDVVTASVDASDPDLRPMGAADPTTLSYEWLRNGAVIVGRTGSTLDLSVAGNGDRGDTILVRVTASDGQLSSTRTAIVTVANTGPSAAVSLSSSSPKTNDVLTATAVGSDVDGDALTYTYAWSVNGVVRRTATTASPTDGFDLKIKGNGDKGDVVTVSVTASDGAVSSAAATASATVR